MNLTLGKIHHNMKPGFQHQTQVIMLMVIYICPLLILLNLNFLKLLDGETWGSTTRGTVTLGGKSGVGRGNINGNTSQTLTNVSGANKITNKLVLYSTGSISSVGTSDGWTNLNTSNGSSYEYDFIDTDASDNQVE